MADDSSIIAYFGADLTALRAAMDEAGAMVGGLATSFEKTGQKVSDSLTGMLTLMTAGIAANYAKSILDNADAIEHMSANLGVGTDALQAFQYAVRASNGTNEDASKILTSLRGKLDEMRAGNTAAADAFQVLGLSAKNFIGLSLDEALAKVAKGYVDNQNQAGAYSALQVLVGKTGKDLNDVLVSLGQNGFGAMIAGAKDAHAIIDGTTLKDLANAKKAYEEMVNALTVGSSQILGVTADALSGIGSLLGAITGKIEYATGAWGKFQAVLEVLAALKDPASAAALVVAQSMDSSAASTEKTKKNLADANETLKVTNTLLELRAKFEEIIQKGQMEGMTYQQKVNALLQEMMKYRQESIDAGPDEVKMQKALNSEAETAVELVKLRNQYQQKTALSMQDELDLFVMQRKGIGALSDAEYARYQILILQKQEKKTIAEITDLEAKLVDQTITPAEKTRLAVLLDQEKKIKDQIAALGDVTKATGGPVLAAAKAVTQEYQTQLDIMSQMKNQSFGSQNFTQMSDAMLQGVIQKAQTGLAAPAPGGGTIGSADQNDWGSLMMANTYRAQISSATQEVSNRQNIRDSVSRNGQAATVAQYGDSAVANAMSGVAQTYTGALTGGSTGLSMTAAASTVLNQQMAASLAAIQAQLKTLTGGG